MQGFWRRKRDCKPSKPTPFKNLVKQQNTQQNQHLTGFLNKNKFDLTSFNLD